VSARADDVLLLDFDWCHPAGWSVQLFLRTGESGLARLLARGITEDDREIALARLGRNPSADRVSRVVEDRIATNGASRGIGLFGSLPAMIENHRPDWIGRDAIARACRAWLDAFGAEIYGDQWDDLASELPPTDGDDDDDGEEPAFDEERKQRITAAYMDQAYRDVARRRRKRA